MFNRHIPSNGHDLVDRAAQRTDAALQAGVDTAHEALDDLGDATRRLQASAVELSQRSVETLREGSRAVRERALWAGERSVGYIRDEPVKSVLLAAAAGAALMALAGLLGSRPRRIGR